MVAWSHVLVQNHLGEAVCNGGDMEGEVCNGGGVENGKQGKDGGNGDRVRPLKPLTSCR